MKLLEEVIRGGQTTMHNWRMGLQIAGVVSWKMLRRCTVVSLVLFAIFRLEHARLQAAWLYIKVKALGGFMGGDGPYAYKSGNETRQYDADTIRTHPYFSGAWDHMLDTGISALVAAAVATVVLGALALMWFKWRGRDLGGVRHIRGGSRVSAPDLDRLAKKTYRGRNRRAPVYRLAGVRYPANGETLHTLIVGSTGTGKTVAMSDLLDQIRRRGDKAIVYDMLGSFVPPFYDPAKDHILNPFDARSAGWTVFSDVSKPHDCETMAAALMPQFKDTADPFWVNAARSLFSSGAKTLLKDIQAMRAKGGPDAEKADRAARLGNQMLLNLVVKADLGTLARRLEETVAQSVIDPKNPKTALSVRTVLTTYLGVLEDLPVPDRLFSIRRWVRGAEDSFLFLSSTSETQGRMQSLIATWLEIATVAILAQGHNENRRTWIIIDELPTLSQIPSLTSLLRLGRQYGACAVLGTQAISELRQIYDRNGAETISANCNTRLSLHTPDMPTAQWQADNFGRREQAVRNESVSLGSSEIRDGRSYTERDEVKQLVLPSEIMGLPALGGFLKMAQLDAVADVVLVPRDREKREPSFIEAPAPDAQPPENGQSGKKPSGPPPNPDPGPVPDPANGVPAAEPASGENANSPAPAPSPPSLPAGPAVNAAPAGGVGGIGEPPAWLDAPEKAGGFPKKPNPDQQILPLGTPSGGQAPPQSNRANGTNGPVGQSRPNKPNGSNGPSRPPEQPRPDKTDKQPSTAANNTPLPGNFTNKNHWLWAEAQRRAGQGLESAQDTPQDAWTANKKPGPVKAADTTETDDKNASSNGFSAFHRLIPSPEDRSGKDGGGNKKQGKPRSESGSEGQSGGGG